MSLTATKKNSSSPVAYKGVVISVASQVMVPQPDIKGRKDILELYVGQIIAKDIDVDKLARMTTGFTGADLENMVNTAAIRAAIEERPHVTMQGNMKFRLRALTHRVNMFSVSQTLSIRTTSTFSARIGRVESETRRTSALQPTMRLATPSSPTSHLMQPRSIR